MDQRQGLPQSDEPNVDYVISSQVKQDTFAFVWNLGNFTTFRTEKEILSPLFYKTNLTWLNIPSRPDRSGPNMVGQVLSVSVPSLFDVQLVLQPREYHRVPFGFGPNQVDEIDSISVYLRLSEIGKEFEGGPNATVNASFETSILDKKDKVVSQQGSQFEYFPFQPMKLSERQDLVTGFWKNDNDTLKLRCRIWIKYSVEHDMSNSFGLNFEENKDAKLRRLEKLACDLQREKTYTDVALVTKTSTLRANKFILAARSPVFRRMLRSPLLYSRYGNATADTEIKIDNFDAEDVASMLEYMYTGTTPVQTEKAVELLKVADFYGLDELKEDCLNVILANDLTVETAVATLALALLYDYSKLKTKVFNFVNRNKKEIFQSDGFKEFAKENPDILFELCSF